MFAGSLFAGIGGFDLGFRYAGFETRWAVDIDAACRSVLRRHFPQCALHSDIALVDFTRLEPVDVVTYGFPCQDVAQGGLRRGLSADGRLTRSGLFYMALEALDFLRPPVAVFENVGGLLTHEKGATFSAILGGLSEIGYDTTWLTADSRHFGLAQRRRRVFGISTRNDRRDIGGRLLACLQAAGQDVPQDPDPGQTPVAPCLEQGAGAPGDGPFVFKSSYYTRLKDGAPQSLSPPLTADADKGDQDPLVFDGLHIRRWTPVEQERLQGFPDGWTEWGVDERQKRIGQSATVRARQLGNAVSVPVAKFVAGLVRAAIG